MAQNNSSYTSSALYADIGNAMQIYEKNSHEGI